VGEHYIRYLEEAEEEFDGGKGDGFLWADVLAVLHASGPPLPLELKIGLLLRQKPSRMGGGMVEEEEESDEAFYDAQQEENENEVEGIKRLNEELGSSQGDDAAQQRLLRAASRWLGSRLKVTTSAWPRCRGRPKARRRRQVSRRHQLLCVRPFRSTAAQLCWPLCEDEEAAAAFVVAAAGVVGGGELSELYR